MITDDRIKILDYPMAIPNRCAGCGIGSYDRKYIDFDLDLPEYGAVYFCEVCYLSAVKQLNWSSPEEIAELRELITFWRKKYEKARETVTDELYNLLYVSGLFSGRPGFPVMAELAGVEAGTGESKDHAKHSRPESDNGKSSDESGLGIVHDTTKTDSPGKSNEFLDI